MLLEINNSTNKGAYRKGMGLVKGASDLLFISPEGHVYAFELKENKSRHDVKHLRRQFEWSMKVNSRPNGAAFFIFSEEQFFRVMEYILQRNEVRSNLEAGHSMSYIRCLIEDATTKTVQINYD
jgi:hypothetical protein